MLIAINIDKKDNHNVVMYSVSVEPGFKRSLLYNRSFISAF